MNIILCNDCGYVFSRNVRKCPNCSRTDFSFYKDPHDQELASKRKVVTGKGAPGSSLVGLLYIAAAVLVVGGAGTLYGVLSGVNPHVVKTQPGSQTSSVAATADSIPH